MPEANLAYLHQQIFGHAGIARNVRLALIPLSSFTFYLSVIPDQTKAPPQHSALNFIVGLRECYTKIYAGVA
jgi:hypothetical protein